MSGPSLSFKMMMEISVPALLYLVPRKVSVAESTTYLSDESKRHSESCLMK